MRVTISATNELPDSTFWRISAKALIYDEKNRLLVFKDKHNKWEMPGGGWEHSETFQECISRELVEEVNALVINVDNVAFCYTGEYHFRGDTERWFPKVNLAAKVTIDSSDINPLGDDLIEVRYVTKEEFLKLPFQPGEAPIKDYVDMIWQT